MKTRGTFMVEILKSIPGIREIATVKIQLQRFLYT